MRASTTSAGIDPGEGSGAGVVGSVVVGGDPVVDGGDPVVDGATVVVTVVDGLFVSTSSVTVGAEDGGGSVDATLGAVVDAAASLVRSEPGSPGDPPTAPIAPTATTVATP